MKYVTGTVRERSSQTRNSRYSLICVLAIVLAGCGVPNLETQECTDARISLRTFYSFHFDRGVTEDLVEDLSARQRFLTPEFGRKIGDLTTSEKDPFTLSDSLPTTFKLGECSSSGSNAVFRVQVYWRDDRSTVQKDLYTAMKMNDSGWLIDDIAATPIEPQR